MSIATRRIARGMARCAAIPALACLISCSNPYALREIGPAARTRIDAVIALVSQARMDADLSTIERSQGGSDYYRRDYASAQLLALGLSVTRVPPYDTIHADIPGSDPGLAPVMVQAHWDRVIGSPGMDDDATGLVGVLECARAIAAGGVANGVAFRRGIRFILFGMEEGGILGSKQYASTLSDAELPSFFVNLEMIGYTADSDLINVMAGQSRGDWIGAYAPDWAADCAAEFARCARLFAPGLKYFALSIPGNFETSPLIDNLARSDHIHFWKRGAPGLMITDGAELRNPNYHGAGDVKATLDLPFMTDVVKASLAAVLLRAEPILP